MANDNQTDKTENTIVGGFRFQSSEDALAASQEETAIRYLRTKIDDKYGIKLIQTVRGVGYVIRG